MAITDMFGGAGLVTNILMKLRVDTTDAKKELKALTGEEKKAAQAALELQEKKNKQMESWSKGIAKVTVGMQLAQKAVSVLGDAWTAYEKAAKAAGGADAEKARAFRESLNSMGRAMDKIMVEIGNVVASLTPLVEVAAALVNVVGEGLSMLGKGRGWVARQIVGDSPTAADEAEFTKWQQSQGAGFLYGDAASVYGPGGRQALGSANMFQQAIIDSRMAAGEEALRAAKTAMVKERDAEAKAREAAARAREADAEEWARRTEMHNHWLAGIAAAQKLALDPNEAYRRGEFSQGIGGESYALLGNAGIDLTKAMVDTSAKNAATAVDKERKKKLESIFGPLSDFDAYSNAFQMLSGSIQGSFDAWVSGSLTAGQALKKFFSDAVSGVASQMFAEAIKHGAFAIGSLAFGDIRGAATHGKAAAAFGAGAIAVGAIARQLNGGGASAGASVGGVPSVTGGGGGGGGGGQTTNVFLVGDGLSDDSPRMRRQSFGRQMRMSRGSLQDSSGVRDG